MIGSPITSRSGRQLSEIVHDLVDGIGLTEICIHERIIPRSVLTARFIPSEYT